MIAPNQTATLVDKPKEYRVPYCDYCGEYLHTPANLDEWPELSPRLSKGKYHDDCVFQILIGTPLF